MKKTTLIQIAALLAFAGLVGCANNDAARAAHALKVVAGPGEIQVVGLPPDTGVIVVRCLVGHGRLNTSVSHSKDYVQLVFKPRPTGSDTTETQETPESFHVREFAPGEMRIELHRWPKKPEGARLVELYENDAPLKFSEDDPNFINLATLRKIEKPETQPSLFENSTIGDEIRVEQDNDD